ncbi:MAG: GntR family transcriptional regulator [Rhodospirillales bacterium]|nr:GntR family transcriptional regulator [Rhodospirillales bacterium]
MTIEPVADQQSLVARVHGAIFDAICDGRLPPGEPLRQERLAEMLGVSRQPIHVALGLLQRQGVVVEHGRRGVRVAPLDPVFVAQLYAVRGALDGLAARQAAGRLDPAAKRAGLGLIAAGRAAVASRDVAKMIAADVAFHQFVYDHSGNPMIARTLDLHWLHIRRLMGQSLSSRSSLDRIWREHEAILGAIAGGDADLADRLSRDHAGRAAEELSTWIADTSAAAQ